MSPVRAHPVPSLPAASARGRSSCGRQRRGGWREAVLSAQVSESSGKVLELEKQVAEGRAALVKQATSAGATDAAAARAEAAESEAGRLREGMAEAQAHIGRLEEALRKQGEDARELASTRDSEREAVLATQVSAASAECGGEPVDWANSAAYRESLAGLEGPLPPRQTAEGDWVWPRGQPQYREPVGSPHRCRSTIAQDCLWVGILRRMRTACSPLCSRWRGWFIRNACALCRALRSSTNRSCRFADMLCTRGTLSRTWRIACSRGCVFASEMRAAVHAYAHTTEVCDMRVQ